MPLVQAKCTNCGANLEIDNTKDAAICPYCGTAFIVEKAINNYNTTNQIHAGTVNIYGGNSADFVIRGGVLVKYNGAATEVVIPSGVTEIGKDAFGACTGITNVIIPNGVTMIGADAFRGCTNLISITIPNSVVSIYPGAFGYCTRMEKIDLPNSVHSIVERLLEGCSKLTNITIPNSVTHIGQYAFSRCTGLTNIIIPDSVELIDVGAFANCTELESIEIPYGVTTIKAAAFSGCINLKKIIIQNQNTELNTDDGMSPFDRNYIQIISVPEEWKKRYWHYFSCLDSYKPKESGCYVATAVYGSYDCPEVWTLRRFRDDTLDRTWYGRAFIRAYYAVSPTLVRWFGTTGWFRSLFKAPLDRFVRKLRLRGVQDTPYQDKY